MKSPAPPRTRSGIAPNEIATERARAWAAYHRDQMVEMEQAIQQALQLDSKDAETHFLHALWYGFNPARSEAMARIALEAYPDLAPAHYVKALADRRAGDLAEARQALERARPDRSDFHAREDSSSPRSSTRRRTFPRRPPHFASSHARTRTTSPCIFVSP